MGNSYSPPLQNEKLVLGIEQKYGFIGTHLCESENWTRGPAGMQMLNVAISKCWRDVSAAPKYSNRQVFSTDVPEKKELRSSQPTDSYSVLLSDCSVLLSRRLPFESKKQNTLVLLVQFVRIPYIRYVLNIYLIIGYQTRFAVDKKDIE